MDSSSVSIELAGTLQSASINRNPSAQHDINPSTAAACRVPANLEKYSSELEDDGEYGVVKPRPRPHKAYPLPDLRFEQSYLKSLEKGNGSWGSIAWITARDMVLMPFVQGVLYNIAIFGWKHWNRNARISGNTLGARLRRWWYGVNNWPVPTHRKRL